MTAAGWYRGEGDPPGTQRYWDGAAWVGEPVYEPPAQVQPPWQPPPPPVGSQYGYAVPVVESSFPGSLKVIAIVVSVLKAIPLAFGAVIVVWLALVSNTLDDEFDDLGFGLDGLVGAAIAFLLVMIVIGALLLVFQLVGAITERPIVLFIPALIMAILDVLFMVGAWADYSEAQSSAFDDGSAGGAMMVTVIAAAQVYIAVQAIRAKQN